MKIIANREALQTAFNRVAAAIPTRTPKPILQNIKIRATDDGTELLATDLDVAIRSRVVGVQIDEPGTAILPKRVAQILATSTDDEITIETTEDGIKVKTARSKFEMPAEDPSLFPDVPAFEGSDYFTLKSSDLRRVIRQTAFCCDVESTRYTLGGSQWEFNGHFQAVATDGRRLALATAPYDRTGAPSTDVFSPVPHRTLKLLEKLLSDDDTPANVIIDRDRVLIQIEETTLYSRLVEGRFPKYQDVIGTLQNQSWIETPVEPFLGGVQQAMILTSEESRGVDFQFALGTLILTSQAADMGKSIIEVPVMAEQEYPQFTIDPSYLKPALAVLPDDMIVRIGLIDEKSAVELQAGDSYRYILMPLTRDR